MQAHPIIAVDINPGKLEYAKSFGATHTINAAEDDPVEAIRDLTGRGADYSFVAVGEPRGNQSGMGTVWPPGVSAC